MNLKIVMLSEGSEPNRSMSFHLYKVLEEADSFLETESRLHSCLHGGRQEGAMIKGLEKTFWGSRVGRKEIFIILIVVMASWVNTCQNSSNFTL